MYVLPKPIQDQYKSPLQKGCTMYIAILTNTLKIVLALTEKFLGSLYQYSLLNELWLYQYVHVHVKKLYGKELYDICKIKVFWRL